MKKLSIPTIVCMSAMMLGSLVVGCGGAGELDEEQVRSDAWLETGADHASEPCEAVQIDTWFGPAKPSTTPG